MHPHRIVDSTHETLTLEVRCFSCRQPKQLTVPRDGYEKWQGGQLIQNAMPSVSTDDRELLISGTCPTCWREIFGDPNDEK